MPSRNQCHSVPEACALAIPSHSPQKLVLFPMNNPNPEDQADRVKSALFAGRKIEAIKLYREQTGVGLAEAKTAVEKLEEELRASTPASFANPPSKGCTGAAVVLVGIVGAVSWLLIRR